MSQDESISLLHLSDIHFGNLKNPNFDLNSDIRNELELSLKKDIEMFNSTKGLLISGDITYRGSENEYNEAANWINKLCGLINLEPWDVWCVPGNHDVNLETLSDNTYLQALRETIIKCNDSELDEKISKYFEDENSAMVLLQPFSNYNKFAAQFGCQFTHNKPWLDGEISLNDGMLLRIRGINSALVSDKKDHPETKKLVVSNHDLNIPREENTIWLSLCHHPPRWLRKEKELTNNLNSRATIQVFGHEHEHIFRTINRQNAQIFSGAFQPHRGEGDWEPRFNWIKLKVEKDGDKHLLNLKLYPYKYTKNSRKFLPDTESCDGNTYKEEQLVLPDIKQFKFIKPTIETTQPTIPLKPIIEVPHEKPLLKHEYSKKEIVYKFLRIPYGRRIQIANELNVISDEDDGQESSQLIVDWIERAFSKGMNEVLYKKVNDFFNDQIKKDK